MKSPSLPITPITNAVLASLESKFGYPLKLEGGRVYIDRTLDELTLEQRRAEGLGEPAKKAKTAPRSKTPGKAPRGPTLKAGMSEAQVRRVVRLRCRRADGMLSRELADVIIGTPDQRNAFLKRMIKDGILMAKGNGPATRYFSANSEPSKPAKAKPAPVEKVKQPKPPKKPPPKITAVPKVEPAPKPPTIEPVPKPVRLSQDERLEAILKILADKQPHRAREFRGVYADPEDFDREWSNDIGMLVLRRQVVRTGERGATRYRLADTKKPEVDKVKALADEITASIRPLSPEQLPLEGDLEEIFGIDFADKNDDDDDQGGDE